MERRDFLAASAITLASSLYAADSHVTTQSPQGHPVHPEVLIPKSLPFDATKLDGLSEKMILSHHQNNYGGAVKRAKLIEEKIAILNADANAFEFGSIKREYMIALNSMILHEYYFDALGAMGKPNDKTLSMLETSFGTMPIWENEFKKMALSLSGGSGWILLVYNKRLRRLENVWSWDHLHGLWDSEIILALDMYEHSYQMDFGANAKGYVETFFKNINWNVINQRISTLH